MLHLKSSFSCATRIQWQAVFFYCILNPQGPMGPPGTDGERGLDGAKVQECTWTTSIIVLIELDKISILSDMLWSHVYYTNESMKFPVLWLAFVKVWGVRCQLQWKFCSSPLLFHNLQNYKQNVCRLKCMKQGSGACFSKVPRTFRVHFRWHNCLCIFKTKAYWGTLQLFLFLFPLQHMKRPPLQNKQAGVLRMASRARKAFKKRAPGE